VPSGGFRFLCYCTDCQAFARFLERPDVLDAAGGTDIFQMPPGRVTLTAGADALRCLGLHARGKVLRWYADCCGTPITNAASSPRFPVVALIRSFMDHAFTDHLADGRSLKRDDLSSNRHPALSSCFVARPDGKPVSTFPGRALDAVLGPPLCRIYERSAIGSLPPNAPPPPSFKVFARRAAKLLGWWWRGLHRPSPFFDQRTDAPLVVPRVLTESERAALERRSAA
jgi:Family of unknown function (DUF6151)